MSTTRTRLAVTAAALAATCFAASGCGRPPPRPPVMAEAATASEGPGGKAAATLAPQAFARAEGFRRDAEKAYAAGDLAGAQILSERALAAYEHAIVAARLAKAEQTAREASLALAQAEKQVATGQTELAKLQADANAVEARARMLHEAIPLSAAGKTGDRAREAARLVAARSLALDARLLCAAAALLDSKAEGLDRARTSAEDLDRRLSTSTPNQAPIDEAMRARQACLAMVTTIRRASAGSSNGSADSLLAELSAMGELAPARDDRGVVVTLRKLFVGNDLSATAREQVRVLVRVAAAHLEFPIEIVVHEHGAGGPGWRDREQQKGQAIANLLAEGGVPKEKVRVEPAGAAHPISDVSRDPARDERIELIFVDPGG